MNNVESTAEERSGVVKSDVAQRILPIRIVMQGVTLQGKAFRPSDWAERLCGVMSHLAATRRCVTRLMCDR